MTYLPGVVGWGSITGSGDPGIGISPPQPSALSTGLSSIAQINTLGPGKKCRTLRCGGMNVLTTLGPVSTSCNRAQPDHPAKSTLPRPGACNRSLALSRVGVGG